jgi:hypothetical protein
MAIDTSVLRGPATVGSYSKNVAGAVDVTLTGEEARYQHIVFTGAITANISVIVPVISENIGKQWTFENQTTGLFTLSVKQPNGMALPIPQGNRLPVTFTSTGFQDLNSSLSAARVGSRYIREDFRYDPVAVGRLGVGAAVGTTGARNLMRFPSTLFEYHIKGTQTILAPVATAVGLDIGMDQTAADGIEMTHGILSRAPVAFVVGTDPAFYVAATIKVADASGANPLVIGFRKAEAYQATVAAYADYAAIGIIGTADPNTIFTTTEAAGGGNTNTDTTMTWADGATKQLKVKVSAAGAVTYEVNNAAPTVVAAFSFTAADVVVPFLFFLNAADLAGLVEISNWEVGLQ